MAVTLTLIVFCYMCVLQAGAKMVDEENDVRIVGLIAMFFLLFVALIGGMKWENRVGSLHGWLL